MKSRAALERRRIVVCGGGASAVLFVRALQRQAPLLRDIQPVDVTLVEARDQFGEGVAYATKNSTHLLNLVALKMSADPDDPVDFIQWLRDNVPGASYGPDSFVPRQIYADYLRDLLAAAAQSPLRIQLKHGCVRGIDRSAHGWRVSLADGTHLDADAAVIATGNPPPRPLKVAPGTAMANVIDDPWQGVHKAVINPDAHVVLIGSSLTAVDVTLELLDRGHRGRIVMISRHGRLPQTHAPFAPVGDWMRPPYPRSIVELTRRVREEAERAPWQTVVDAVRPKAQQIWQGLSLASRRRFLRHAKTLWEIHRHRMPPEIAARIARAIIARQVEVMAARLLQISSNGEGLTLKLRTQAGEQDYAADVVINCTGPNADPRDTKNPLIADLMRQGLARPDTLSLGLDTDDQDRLIALDGHVNENLHAVGPAARGHLWEITGIGDIRDQAARLAKRLASAPLPGSADVPSAITE